MSKMDEAKNCKLSSDLDRCMPSFPNIPESTTDHLSTVPTTQVGTTQNLSLHLIGLNVRSEHTRDMSGLETISAGWVMCNSWAGIAATFALSIAQGGPVILIYGPIIMFVLVGSCALSLAELASVYPTAGGQYHWTSILAPKGYSRGLVRFHGRWPDVVADLRVELLLRCNERLCLDRYLCWNRYHRSSTPRRIGH
jgi:hypothetical protein